MYIMSTLYPKQNFGSFFGNNSKILTNFFWQPHFVFSRISIVNLQVQEMHACFKAWVDGVVARTISSNQNVESSNLKSKYCFFFFLVFPGGNYLMSKEWEVQYMQFKHMSLYYIFMNDKCIHTWLDLMDMDTSLIKPIFFLFCWLYSCKEKIWTWCAVDMVPRFFTHVLIKFPFSSMFNMKFPWNVKDLVHSCSHVQHC